MWRVLSEEVHVFINAWVCHVFFPETYGNSAEMHLSGGIFVSAFFLNLLSATTPQQVLQWGPFSGSALVKTHCVSGSAQSAFLSCSCVPCLFVHTPQNCRCWQIACQREVEFVQQKLFGLKVSVCWAFRFFLIGSCRNEAPRNWIEAAFESSFFLLRESCQLFRLILD